MIQRQQIESTFAELLGQIADPDLRRRTVDTWMLAIEEGGWRSMEELSSMPFTLLTNCRGVNFLEHTVAVTQGAIGLAKAQMAAYQRMPYDIDMDRLIAGGLLHDVGKLTEFERKPDGTYVKSRAGKCARHPISGAILAAKAGLPQEVINMIACHAKEGEGRPQVVETVLVHQADFGTFDPLVMLEKGTLIV
ncbi:MAG: HDIG domain-containing protein [Bradymonadales bacterium]|nr:HDIG domain-containing protein [Bradymonadales bacterium]